MALVNNATGVYTTLGYNFSDPNGYVQNLSTDTQTHLNAMPAFIQAWQAQDIANNTVNGYFQNPVANVVQSIWNTANSIISLTALTPELNTSIYVTAASLYVTSNNFMNHTNRLSNITTYNGQDITNPYYDTAMSAGRSVLYITNQTDAVINTSPILGSFTSILIGPQISANANTISPYVTTINTSITITTDGGGNTTYSSNLTNTQITSINNGLSNVNNYLSSRQSSDVTFYNNLQSLLNNYNTLKQFSNMGDTQLYLLNNFIGTPKLVSRINS
jgi:nitrogen fixation/metabolism regulation signal transduction histidine kinase